MEFHLEVTITRKNCRRFIRRVWVKLSRRVYTGTLVFEQAARITPGLWAVWNRKPLGLLGGPETLKICVGQGRAEEGVQVGWTGVKGHQAALLRSRMTDKRFKTEHPQSPERKATFNQGRNWTQGMRAVQLGLGEKGVRGYSLRADFYNNKWEEGNNLESLPCSPCSGPVGMA